MADGPTMTRDEETIARLRVEVRRLRDLCDLRTTEARAAQSELAHAKAALDMVHRLPRGELVRELAELRAAVRAYLADLDLAAVPATGSPVVARLCANLRALASLLPPEEAP